MEFWALSLFVITSSITPGPNNVMIMTSGANFGVKASIPHLAGIEIGFAFMVVLVGLGAGTLFQTYPVLLLWLKAAGVIYLSYLAWQIATSHSKMTNNGKAKPFTFLQAAAFQWVNPKAWIMAVGAVVTFTIPDWNYYLQVCIIALVYLILGTPCTSFWLGCGTILRQWLQTGQNLKYFNFAMAGLLFLSLYPSIKELIELTL